MGGKAKTPKPNPEADYQQYLIEGSNALKAQEELLGKQIAAEGRLQPALTAQQMASFRGQAQGLLGLYGDLYAPAQQMQERYGADQLAMLGRGGQMATQAAIGSMDATTRGIYDTFGQQALSDLQMGSSLNVQETTQAQQSARAAAQSRGLSFSRQGSDLEILNTYSMGQRRQAQRQGVAQQAYQMGTTQQQIGLQGFLNPAYQASQQYGLSGLVQSAQASYGSLGQSSFLQPESQYLANIRANRIQMETAIQSANAARSGSIIGGALSAAGQIGGAAIGQGIASVGSSIGKGIEGAEQRRIENAKTQGALNPYLRTEVENVNRSVENGFLQVGKDGKVSIVAGQEKNLDPNKIGRAIDLYNQTDGGKKELKTADLAGLVSTIQSYDTLEKQAIDRQKASRDAKMGEIEYQSKLLSNAAALSQGIAGFATQKRSIASAMAQQGNTAGAQALIAESNALSEKSQAVLMDAYGSTGINVQAFMPKPVTPPPARPAAVAVGSGASTLYTVNAPAETAAPAGMDVSRFNSAIGAVPTTKAPSLEAPAATVATAPIAAPVDYGNRVDGTKKGTGFLGEIKMADGRVATEVSVGVNINGKDVEIPTLVPTLSAEQKSFIAGGGDPRTRPDIIRAATDYASKRIADGKSPFNEPAKASAATGRNLMLGTMPKVETAKAAPAVGAPVKPVTVGKPEYVVQAETEIKSLQTQKEIYTDQFKRARVNRAMVGLDAD